MNTHEPTPAHVGAIVPLGRRAAAVPEFVVVWFESTDKWFAFKDDGKVIGNGASVGAATAQALKLLGKSEADYEIGDGLCEFYRYLPDFGDGARSEHAA